MLRDSMIYDGGFSQPVFQSQSVFKAVMEAMARPGSTGILEPTSPPMPMGPGAGAIALALCDHDTPVHLSAPLIEAGVPGWLAFQSGALLTDERTEAHFAFIDVRSTLPPLTTFSSGTQEYPDRSTTIVMEVPSLTGGPVLLLSGPGIETSHGIAPQGLTESFEAMWADNAKLYPRGVDLILVAGLDIICLPRTTHIRKRER